MRLIRTSIVIQCMLVLFCVLARAKSPEQQPVFISGQDGYHTYRIPALLTTAKGTLLAFCEGRKNSGGDSGDIDLLLKKSTDSGKTWSRQITIWDDSTNTCGNPCAVQDQETKTIFLFSTQNLGQDHEREIHSGQSKGTRTVWLMKSDDDGNSWSKPQEITSQVKDPSWRWYATGPGIGIQIQYGEHKGRLLIPCDHSVVSGDHVESQSHVIYSDDHGQTWKLGGTIRPNMNECQVVEMAEPKGGLLISMRNLPHGSNRAQSISRDGGITWTKPVRHPQLLDPTCQASILRYSWCTMTKNGAILFSNPANSTGRSNLTVRASFDDGKTWPLSAVIQPEESAYSCLAVLPNQEIGCLYERCKKKGTEAIAFARFPFSLLKK